MEKNNFEKQLREIYYEKSGKYKGIERLWNHVRGRDGFFGLKFREVKKFVEKQQSYQLTKQFRNPGTRRKGYKVSGEEKGNGFTTVRAPKPGHSIQIDLMFFNPLERLKGTKYSGVLNVLDVHSRKAWSKPFKTKKAKEIKKIFKEIITQIESEKGKKSVKHMNQDDGKEFMGVFKKYVDKKGIKQHISARDDFAKNPIVERFNRTVRELMAKFAEDYPGEQILGRWQEIIKGYNNTYHKTIKNKPQKVWAKHPKEKNTQKYYDVDYDFKVGDKVRVVRKKTLVEKGKYAWKPGLYTIQKKKKRSYVLISSSGEVQKRRYMGYEMQKVDSDVQVSDQYSKREAKKAKKKKAAAKAKKRQKRQLRKEGISDNAKANLKKLPERVSAKPKEDEYVVEKITKRRKRNNRYEYRVSWKGFSDKTWEPRSSFVGGARKLYEEFDRTQ